MNLSQYPKVEQEFNSFLSSSSPINSSKRIEDFYKDDFPFQMGWYEEYFSKYKIHTYSKPDGQGNYIGFVNETKIGTYWSYEQFKEVALMEAAKIREEQLT